MTKEIINGIDVSECRFCCWKHNVNELIENYCAVFNNKCICNPDCFFKQLKRLEKENEELKNRNNDLIEEIASGNIDISILQKENEELKEKLKNQYI